MHVISMNHPLLLKDTAAQILLPMGDFHSQRRCERVCKLWYDLFKACAHYQVAKEDYFATKIFPGIAHFPTGLIEAFGGKKKVVQLPVLPKNAFCDLGPLYTSFMVVDQTKLGEQAVYRFEHKNRQGIAISYTLLHPHYFDREVMCLHQEHKNEKERWMRSGIFHWPQKATYEDLAWLLAGEFLTVDDEDYLLHFQLGLTRECPLTHRVDPFMRNASTVFFTLAHRTNEYLYS